MINQEKTIYDTLPIGRKIQLTKLAHKLNMPMAKFGAAMTMYGMVEFLKNNSNDSLPPNEDNITDDDPVDSPDDNPNNNLLGASEMPKKDEGSLLDDAPGIGALDLLSGNMF